VPVTVEYGDDDLEPSDDDELDVESAAAAAAAAGGGGGGKRGCKELEWDDSTLSY